MRIVVIGGGITGLFIAFTLVKNYDIRDIIILEKKYIGSGGTFRCATGIRASFTSREHVVLMKRSIELWKQYSEELKHLGFVFHQHGYLWIARKNETLEIFRKLALFHNELGVPTRVIDRDEVLNVVPNINKDVVVGGLYDPIAGKAPVFDVVYALIKYLRSRGVDIRTGVEVRKLISEGSRIVYAETNHGVIYGDVFVLATGAESRDLAKTIGVSLPIVNEPRHALITEAYRDTIKPLVIDWDTPGVPYIVQVSHGGFYMSRNIVDEPEISIYLQRVDAIPLIVKPLVELFPFLKHVNVLRYWIGYYVVTPDHHPIYGPIKEFENLFIATGFSGHGYMMAPVSGEIIASWIVEGRPRIEEAYRLTLDRFERGELVKEIAIVG